MLIRTTPVQALHSFISSALLQKESYDRIYAVLPDYMIIIYICLMSLYVRQQLLGQRQAGILKEDFKLTSQGRNKLFHMFLLPKTNFYSLFS